MSVLPSISRRARSRWMEPVVTAVGAAILGLTMTHATPRMPQTSDSPPPPETNVETVRTSPPPALEQWTIARRVRITLKRAPSPPPAGRIYHIAWGDTLWSLAQRFHVSVASLEVANHLSNPDIEAGSYLVIPEVYHVKPGDTLAAVARAFNVPLVLLWHENRLTRDKLQPGQTLLIPYTGRIPKAEFSAPEMRAAPALNNRGGVSLAANLSPEDILMLAHLVQAEAGNQPFLGQVAVAAVALNRLKTPGYPKTLDGVLFQPGQFETVANGTFWQAPSKQALAAARAAASGWDPTDGALYFYNPSMTNDNWLEGQPVAAVIGNQVFCR
ncbi:cell wall hydrolase [Sulfobacillus harzensis]|uniref:LysM peptidoglycan-binding domain-containing protein n=1 Tax=Sulfobacillus harzensis TaxID=2729629 RepID=A0A7Y0L019_9FIRM|nr:cell wall hydrolase [Sulfobacillus harzensis]NMP20834.1 LysM peptidoglycan-binding domain-containing protein [Sulfobacillus harzensis]